MTSSPDAAIVPITLTVNGRIGLTLYAPPWEDDDGELWQGFLGDGAKIVLFPTVRELAAFIASGEENDLSDHPAWGRVQKVTPEDLRPSADDAYDLDAVYEWAAGDPDPVSVSALANVVDMVAKIADSCDDGALRRLVENTPAYEQLVDEENTYQGKDGRARWNELGDTIADSWERAIGRVESWLSWRGDFSGSDLDAETVWDRIGAEPIEIRLPNARYLTVRGYVAPDAEDGQATEAAFLGSEDTVAVFTSTQGLARYCRVAEEHRLRKLEWWGELAAVEDDAVFTPGLDGAYDLRRPSAAGAGLVRELVAFCDLDADLSVLDGPSVNRDDWNELVAQVATCLVQQD
ncbi:MAG: hypothetical protein EPN43_11945 [Jatrophihabitans sp.]|nr:MAG: hypothetical protein EPN43_11945 [Jatrophihabitans sp.]